MFQIDEFCHYAEKNSVKFGFGLLHVEKQVKFLPFFVETEQSTKCIWKLIKTLQPKYIYADNLASYREVLPSEKHVIGKKHI